MDYRHLMDWRIFLPAARRLRETGLACVGAGAVTTTAGGAPMRPRRLGCHAVVFVTTGTGWFGWGRRRRTVRAPAVLWLFPDIEHAYGPGPDGWSETWLMYEGVAAGGYAAYGLNDPDQPVIELEQPFAPTLAESFDELQALTGRPGTDAQLIAATLAHRVLGLAAAATRGPAPAQTSLVAEITASSSEDLTVADRARRAAVSPARLREVVRQATGLTPHELILRTRISRAQHLLVSSDLTVAEIARQVGYEDPAYFSRLFTRRTGTSPRAFRRLP